MPFLAMATNRESPLTTIVSAAPCNAAFNSSWLPIRGGCALFARVSFTRVAATGNMTLLLQWSPDQSVVCDVQSPSVPASGAYTLTNTSWVRASGSVSFDVAYVSSATLPPFGFVRLRMAAGMTAAGVTDLCTINAVCVDLTRTA